MSEIPTENPSNKPSSTDSVSTNIESAAFVDNLSVPVDNNIITPSTNTNYSVSTNEMLETANDIVKEASETIKKHKIQENNETDAPKLPSYFNNLTELCRHCHDNPIKLFKNPTYGEELLTPT